MMKILIWLQFSVVRCIQRTVYKDILEFCKKTETRATLKIKNSNFDSTMCTDTFACYLHKRLNMIIV